MSRSLKFLVPNILAAIRFATGPCYLAWGTVPTSGLQLTLLLLAAGTDLIDGRIARAWGVTSTFGRFLDAIADRLLIACVLLKLAYAGVVPTWVIVAMFVQYAMLSAVFLAHIFYAGVAPQPDLWARLGAGVAAVAGVVGLSTGAVVPTAALLVLFMAANAMYVIVVGARTLSKRKEGIPLSRSSVENE